MFAAAFGRADVIRVLTAHGADVEGRRRKAIDLAGVRQGRAGAARGRARPQQPAAQARPRRRAGAAAAAARPQGPQIGRRRSPVQLHRAGRHWGGLTPLHLAARQGETRGGQGAARRRRRRQPARRRRQDHAAADRRRSTATSISRSTCSTRAPIRTWRRTTASTPLYAALNCQWAAKALYPQPRAYKQQQHVVSRPDEGAARQGRRPERAADARRSGTRSTTSISRASTRPARRRSGAPPTPATSTR